MGSIKDNVNDPTPQPREKQPRSRAGRIGRIVAWSLGLIVSLIIILLTGVTLWLTPERLTELVNREASEWLDADVKASGVRFTVWSSFPHFSLETDSLRVTSRTLDSITPAQRDSLPADASRLLTTGRIHGSINLLQLLRGVISLRDVEVSYLDLNLVVLNDSLSNFDILPPESRGSFKIPRFTANSVRLPDMRPVKYFSAPTATVMTVPVDSARLERTKPDHYRLTFAGLVSLRSDGLVVLRDFPVSLCGDVSTAFYPLRVRLSDFDVALADTKGKINLDLDFGDNAAINRFSYDLGNLNPISLLSYLPGVQLPFLQELKANIDLNLSAQLTSPYLFSGTTLPSLAIGFHSADGNAEYNFGGDQHLKVRDIRLDGSFNFDGTDPARSYVRVDRLSLSGEGANLNVSADITDLTTNPAINADVEASTQLSHLPKYFPFLRGYGLEGSVDFNSRIAFLLSSQENATVTSPQASGSMTLSGVTFSEGKTRSHVDALKINFEAGADCIGNSGMGRSALQANLLASKASVNMPGYNVEAPKLSANFTLHSNGGNEFPETALSLALPAATIRTPSTDMSISGLDMDLDAHSRKFTVKGEAAENKSPDSEALNRLRHSPEYITAHLPADLRDLYSRIALRVRLRTRKGEISTPSFPAANTFSNLALTITNDSINLSRLRLRSLKSEAVVSGWLSGLDNLLLTGRPTPLHAHLMLEGDTISINQLAHAYAHGVTKNKNPHQAFSAPASAAPSASDSTALLIPRNLQLHMDAAIKETVYTDLHLYDLRARLDALGGNMKVSDLHISSDFGHASLDLGYNTTDILNIGLNADAALEDIELVRFFQRFHSLLLMMPQMKNLSGTISAEAGMNMHIYPDMDADVASLTARIGAQGRDLKVHQDAFIRRITRMMMIRTNDDLHIANMNVRASVHDNLLELYPFTCSFDRYRISMQGINNFNGRLYYHVGVLESPLHFPFGINIKGMFSHPELRFGGATYKVEEGAEVARHVEEMNTFNIIKEAKHFLREFLRKAAESDDTPEHSYVAKKI